MKKSKSKPPKAKPVKYKIIQLTDFQLHSTQKQPPLLVGKKFQTAFETNTPGRFYNTLPKPAAEQKPGTFSFKIDLGPDFLRMVQEEEAKGYKVIIKLPDGGAPVFLGKDTIQFMASKNGKRIHRGREKIDKKKT